MAAAAPWAARAAGGVVAALYPSPLGEGTLNSPEAIRQMNANLAAANANTPGYGSENIGDSAYGNPAIPGVTSPLSSAPPITPSAAALTHAPQGSPGSVGSPDTPPANYRLGSTFPNPSDQAMNAGGPAQNAALAAAFRNNPTDRQLIDVAAGGGQPYSPVFAGNSTPTGGYVKTADGWTTQNPAYTTPYYDKSGNQIASVTGPDRRVGGGTLSAPDQGNGGTIEGNVAAINRQYEALKSRNDAYNGTGGGLPATGAQTQPAFDPFSRPGDSWGDSEKRQNEYQGLLRDAASARPRRAAAMMASAQGLLAPGLAQMERQGQFAQGQGQQQAGLYKALLDAQNDRAGRAFDAAKWGQQYGLDKQQLGLKQQQADLETARNAGLDQATLANKTATTAALQEKNALLNDALHHADPKVREEATKKYQDLYGHIPDFMNALMQGHGQGQ
jgi:hypothetical protein